jgi:ABC-2 type transport system permease protein
MRLLDFLVKELLQLRRDRRMLFSLLAMPILQLILFGYALNTDVKHIGVAVCDQDHSAESRDLVRQMTSSEYFDYLGSVSDPDRAQSLLASGRADVILVIPPDFARKAQAGDTAQVQALVDGSNPNTGTIAVGYLGAIFQTRGVQLLAERIARAGQPPLTNAGIDMRLRVWYNPALETKDSMVPGVVCTVVGMMAMMLSATAIVKEREDGTIEQLIVTPVRTWELMLGKTLPILLVGYVEIITVLTAGVLLFGVPVRGSVPLMLAFAGPFLIASLAIGLIVSTVSYTQHQASLTISFFAMPSMLLSGFIFPISSMPTALQWATYLIPMRYFLIVVRDILLKGSGAGLLWNQVIPLTLLAIGFMSIATWRFQKKLD